MIDEYKSILKWLFDRSRSIGMDLGLERIRLAADVLNSPHTRYPSIHIAGTNGKGSVSVKTAKALEFSGYKVGLYTSPHIRSIGERICINSVALSPERFIALFRHIESVLPIHQESYTFFEILTLMAFYYFQQESVDIAVFETGLGGRLDATNILMPLVTVITSIGLDHTAYLGDTLDAIAFEKAGIIKPNTPIVIGPHVPRKVIEEIAFVQSAPLFIVEESVGTYDDENSAIAQEVCRILQEKMPLDNAMVELALSKRPNSRFEEKKVVVTIDGVCSEITSILDVAHNPQGIERLFQMYDVYYPNSRPIVIFAGSREKDVEVMLRTVASKAHSIILTTDSSSQRLLSPSELYEKAKIDKEGCILAHSLEEAIFEYAIPEAITKKLPVLITGSFFIMAGARKLLGYVEFEDPLCTQESGLSRNVPQSLVTN